MQQSTHAQPSQTPITKLAFNRIEAAEVLGVSPSTVDRLTKRGLLRPSRAIGRPLYSLKELERFLAETSETVEVAC